MPDPARARPRMPLALAGLVGLVVFLYLLGYPAAIRPQDEGILLYGARRILLGEAPYRDFFEFITPAAFYFFALVFALGGISAMVARTAMAAVIAASSVLVYVLARNVARIPEAVLAALLVGICCYPVWLMASPHWMSTFLCLATAAVLLRDGVDGWKGWTPTAAGALAGLAFCNQQQRGVALAVWLTVALVLLATHADEPRRLGRAGRALVAALAGWIAVVVAILGYSVWRSSFRDVVYAIFTFVLTSYRRTFTGKMAWGGSVTLSAYAVDYSWPWMPAAVLGVLGIEGLTLLWALRRRRGASEVVRGCLLLLAMTMAASVLYFPDFVHVAFITPFSLIVAARLWGGIFSQVASRGGALRLAMLAATATASLAVGIKAWRNLERARIAAPIRYASGFGTLAGTEESRRELQQFQDAMRDVSPERRTFFSYPDNAALYLTVPGRNPIPFSYMLRGYNTPEQYRIVQDAIERTRPDFVVVNALFFVNKDDPVVQCLEGRYRQHANAGTWGLNFIYRRIDREEGGDGPTGAERRAR